MSDSPSTDPLPQELTRDARLVAIETRQKLRDEHVDRRFDAMNAEFSSLDKRVSAQIAGLDHKIEVGFRMLSEELKTDRAAAVERTGKMYDDIRAERDNESNRPPSVRVSLLISVLGVVFPTVSAAGIVILLLVNPVKEKLDDHMSGGSHGDVDQRVALLEERTQNDRKYTDEHLARAEEDRKQRHEEHQAALAIHAAQIAQLNEQRVKDAERWGRAETLGQWLRDDIEACKEDLRVHEAKSEHPTSNNAANIARIEGTLGLLKHQIDEVHSRKPAPRPQPPPSSAP